MFDCLSDGAELFFDGADGGLGTKSAGGRATSGFEAGAKLSFGTRGYSLLILKLDAGLSAD